MSFNVDNQTYQELQAFLKATCSYDEYPIARNILSKFEPVALIDYISPEDEAFEGFVWLETDPLKVSEQLEYTLNGNVFEGLSYQYDVSTRDDEFNEDVFRVAMQNGLLKDEDEILEELPTFTMKDSSSLPFAWTIEGVDKADYSENIVGYMVGYSQTRFSLWCDQQMEKHPQLQNSRTQTLLYTTWYKSQERLAWWKFLVGEVQNGNAAD